MNTEDAQDSRAALVNYEAEQALLAAVLADNSAYDLVCDWLLADHFADPAHGRIYDAAARAIERGQIANAVSIGDRFDQDEALEQLGGRQYLRDLQNAHVSSLNARHYGQVIFDLAQRRRILEVAQDAEMRAGQPGDDDTGDGIAMEVAEALDGIQERSPRDRTVHVGDAADRWLQTVEAAMRADGGLVGITSGLSDLDEITQGFMPGWQAIIAGRPGMGKTALGLNIAFNAARLHWRTDGEQGAPAMVASLEMEADTLTGRLLAGETGITQERQQAGLTQDEYERLRDAKAHLDELPLYINDTPAMSIARLRSHIRRLKRQRGVRLVVVDYLQLMSASANAQRKANDTSEASEISTGLKNIAKELGVAMIALSQLSRRVEERDDKRPVLSDLRQSGQLEQDADLVLFTYRDEYYAEREEPVQGPKEKDETFQQRKNQWDERMAKAENTCEILLPKHRHARAPRHCKLHWDGERQRFGNLETRRMEGV